MKRILLSLIGGVVIPTLLLFIVFFMMHIFELTPLEPLAYALLIMVIWPLKIFNRIFPAEGMAFGPTDAALIGTAICTVLFYSILTYGILWLRAKRKRLP